MSEIARLVLEDGSVFEGELFGHRGSVSGEVVFNTGMVGYPEALTDPSYSGEILVCTYPLIGNYGVPPYATDKFGLPIGFESPKIQASALIVSEYSQQYHHRTAARSLDQWLKSEQIPALSGIDTRAVTKKLREHGTMLGRIEIDGVENASLVDTKNSNLVEQVSVKEMVRYQVSDGAPTIVLIDCGCKANIIRSLLARNVNVIRVPHDQYFLNYDFDGILISNGPGDPKMCAMTIRNIERALALSKPILGICLGQQLLALAVGADTYKLKFGHRSQNQPCIEYSTNNGNKTTGRCVITSQNHGYTVREQTLPSDWKVWFRNANDNTLEGIKHASKPFASVQFHPEAFPGPVDTAYIFDEFVAQVTRLSRYATVS